MQKVKKEDFRIEEELRTQKVKYEEANDDVFRRMQDIKDAEVDGVVDLEAFLDAQLSYHEQCREVLLQLKTEWPSRYVGTDRNLRIHKIPIRLTLGQTLASPYPQWPPNRPRQI